MVSRAKYFVTTTPKIVEFASKYYIPSLVLTYCAETSSMTDLWSYMKETDMPA